METFSFGFGPRLFGFKRGETDFRFSPLLFGGYVKMAGEQAGRRSRPIRAACYAKPRWQRLFIAFAGPAINVVLAVVLLTGLFMVHYPKIPTPHDPKVGYVAPDGAAAKAGIREGDQVVQIDDTVNPTWEDIAMKEISSAHAAVGGLGDAQRRALHFTLTPALDEKNGIGYLGWAQEIGSRSRRLRPRE